MSLKTGELIQNELRRGGEERRKKKKINISYFLFLCSEADRGRFVRSTLNPIKIKLITKKKNTHTHTHTQIEAEKISNTGVERER